MEGNTSGWNELNKRVVCVLFSAELDLVCPDDDDDDDDVALMLYDDIFDDI